MNAARFALPPLPQPTYSFAEIPRACPDLKGSTIEYVTEREGFQRCMAEMLLVCKEAVRRRRHRLKETTNHGCDSSKPLSLEYLADRMDVDEPLWGYIIRNEGRLQGFVTVTTFTNYQKNFRWDSGNEAAFAHDDDETKKLRTAGVRKTDQDGSLARKMQASVRCGDIWQEGVVWPRIAEISLLGGLGCGKVLLELVLEDLERMKASSKANYDFVALQATHNSISFYESLGFLRVGAVTLEEKSSLPGEDTSATISPPRQHASTANQAKTQESEDLNTPDTDLLTLPDNYVMSKIKTYEVKKAGEVLSAIAKKFKVDVFDILFLNQMNYPDLAAGSRLIKGTMLRIPDPSSESLRSTRKNVSVGADELKWYTAKENDTPRSISRMFNISCVKLVQANKNRLKGLLSNSRLKQGTQVRISHLDAPDVHYVPYAHWAFPDDDHFEDGEPSYMMAMSLDRVRGAAAKIRPVRESLVPNIEEYQNSTLVHHVASLPGGESWSVPKEKRTAPLADPPSGYELFSQNFREKNQNLLSNKGEGESAKIVEQAWKDTSVEQKASFVERSAQLRLDHRLSSHQDPNSSSSDEDIPHARPRITPGQVESQENLFNMVVRIKPGIADTVDVDTQEFKYWYVLTFIPDLRWCHLAPMIQDGTFGSDKPKAQGRPRWKLVDESLGKELDITSSICIPCKSRGVKRTVDADKEEWDIQDDGKPALNKRMSFSSEAGSSVMSRESSTGSTDMEEDGAQKKRRNSTKSMGPVLLAIYPGCDRDVKVKLTGNAAPKTTPKPPSSRKRKHPASGNEEPANGGSENVNLTGASGAERTNPGLESDKEQEIPSSDVSTSTATTTRMSSSIKASRTRKAQPSMSTATILSRLENNQSTAPPGTVQLDLACFV